ncbi:MAG: hypothetical protein WD226_07900 [Planctomycetota bacterium]
MNCRPFAWLAGALLVLPLSAQHVQVTSVARRPGTDELWIANRGNDSVSVVDVVTGTTTHEIEVGVWPRSVAFSADGSTAFVTNQRGNVAVTKHAATPFDGTEVRGSISVIDASAKSVSTTLASDVGVEPYGIATSPNGAYLAVTAFRSAKLQLFSTTAPYALLTELAYEQDLSVLPPGTTVADVDSNFDGIPDLSEPRAFVLRSDSARLYVTHLTPGYVSVVDVALDGAGVPTGLTLVKKIDLNTYPYHPIQNPVPVQTLDSAGLPRFLDDVALSPDGATLVVPHVLHNVNHDVNFDFTTLWAGFEGDFANRVHPALSLLDATTDTFGGQVISHSLTASLEPAEHIAYGGPGANAGGGVLTLGSLDQPVLGTTVTFTVAGVQPGDFSILAFSETKVSVPSIFGTLLTVPTMVTSLPSNTLDIAVPNDPALENRSFYFQAGVVGPLGVKGLTNGVEAMLSSDAIPTNDLAYRAGQPGRVLYNAAGDRALLINRGSEDVFLFEVTGSDFRFLDVFPPRQGFTERTALDTTTPLGDLPLGVSLVADTSTTNDDALLYVHNESTRTLSSLRVDWQTGVLTQAAPQLPLLLGPDKMTASEIAGQELFEDASRAQTAGNFNNSCASCHFEGGADGNVWQRSDGPRTTMPVFGGADLTGLLLWKGTRLNMGETGPMFGGENGGHGLLSDEKQQALIDYHAIIPVPLNPNRDPATGGLTALAAEGQDLFFGTNDTGTNPFGRSAGCGVCHPRSEFNTFTMLDEPRGFTADHLDPVLTTSDMLGSVDPNCFSLRENIVAENIRNINSMVNVDADNDGIPEVDRNSDGFSDIETYLPMNIDTDSDFVRDDPNGYMCPEDGGPTLRLFNRNAALFSIPTKLGVFSTPPYMHDNSIMSLRTLLDPQTQIADPTYGNASYPGLGKFINEFHDVRGDDTFVPGASKVQVTLQTASAGSTVDADVEALLAFIRSL